MWTQLNLFDEQTDIDFAMSLTSAQLAGLKHREEYSYRLGQTNQGNSPTLSFNETRTGKQL
jgi:hypothetical protein